VAILRSSIVVMYKVLALAALATGVDAMAGRPSIGVGGAVKAAATKAVKKVVNPADLSASIPFAPRPEKLDGTLIGDIGFDPLGLSNLWDLNWLRAAELKHGRVGMLASFGFLVQVRASWNTRAPAPAPACAGRFRTCRAHQMVPLPPRCPAPRPRPAARSIRRRYATRPTRTRLTRWLLQEGYRLPGPASNPTLFSAAKTPLEALSTAPPLGLAQIVAIIFLIEIITSGKLLNTESFYEDGPIPKNAPAGSGSPGDLGWDPLGLSSGGLNTDYAIAELKHGRLGMLGAAGASQRARESEMAAVRDVPAPSPCAADRRADALALRDDPPLPRAGMLAGSLVSGKSVAEQTYDWLGLPFSG
jgi:hypothetical protein